jgi:hypothetical protein
LIACFKFKVDRLLCHHLHVGSFLADRWIIYISHINQFKLEAGDELQT